MESNSSNTLTASTPDPKPRSCAVCATLCSQYCSFCNKISYCSREHQRTHWKTHKPDCFPAEIQHSPTVGRHLVATRLIKAGETILKEKPLVSGPNCGAAATADEKYHPLCLTCFRLVRSAYVCTKCKWPLCGPQCEAAKLHSQAECPRFHQKHVPPFSANESFMYEKIIILRALLCKESNLPVWKRVMDLESHSAERKESLKGRLLSSTAIEFVHETCGLRHEYTNEEIDHVAGALATNAFWNNDNTADGTVFRSGSYLYYYGSLPAHSCIPNSSWTIQMSSEFHLCAAVDIRPGESITQLYTEATMGTLERRSHLKETKYFDCACPRCSDPTELGSYFSAVKCTDCPDGYLLPSAPLNENSEWSCQSSQSANSSSSSSSTTAKACGKTKPRTWVDQLLQDIRAKINLVNESDAVDCNNEKSSLGCISALRKLLTSYTGSVLHPNHFLIYEIENIIVQRISYLIASQQSQLPSSSSSMNDTIMQLSNLMIDLCRKVLHITDILLPGVTTHRGRLMYFLQQGLTTSLYLTLIKRPHQHQQQQQTQHRSTKNAKSKLAKWEQSHVETLREIERLRSEAKVILSHEPEGREEYWLHQILSEPSDNLKFIYRRLMATHCDK